MKNLKVKVIMVLVVGLGLVLFSMFNGESAEAKERKALESSLNKQSIQNEIITENINKADKMITEIKSTLSFNVVEEVGEFNIKLDKTPENNWWSEWLYNSELNFNAKYKAIISLNISDINLTNINGVVYAEIRTKDFFVNAVELYDKAAIENTNWLGKAFNTSDIIAIEKQVTDRIKADLITEEIIKLGKTNIDSYLQDFAKLCNVPVIITID